MRIVVTGSLLLLTLGCTHSNKNTDVTRILDNYNTAIIIGTDTLVTTTDLVCKLYKNKDGAMCYEIEAFKVSQTNGENSFTDIDTKTERDTLIPMNRLIAIMQQTPLLFQCDSEGIPVHFIDFATYLQRVKADKMLARSLHSINDFLDSVKLFKRISDLYAPPVYELAIDKKVWIPGLEDSLLLHEALADDKKVADTAITEVQVFVPVRENSIGGEKVTISGSGNNKVRADVKTRLINQGRFRLDITITKDGDTSEIGTLRKIDKVFLPKQ